MWPTRRSLAPSIRAYLRGQRPSHARWFIAPGHRLALRRLRGFRTRDDAQSVYEDDLNTN
eukprot:6018409-Pleurochrysis_carterae.AAC.2